MRFAAGLVALGLRPSVHAAAKSMMQKLPVSIQALYDKMRGTEPEVVRKLVSGSAERLKPVMQALIKKEAVPGYRLRIVDGNHLPASEKRLKALREFRGAALSGQSLVVYDPDLARTLDEEQMDLSSYYIATQIKANYAGMLIAVTASVWQRYESLHTQELAKLLLALAAKTDPRQNS